MDLQRIHAYFTQHCQDRHVKLVGVGIVPTYYVWDIRKNRHLLMPTSDIIRNHDIQLAVEQLGDTFAYHEAKYTAIERALNNKGYRFIRIELAWIYAGKPPPSNP